jgi:16S rRNA (adenine1518-N6/adenine1519-N6)-dimethyltransferase
MTTDQPQRLAHDGLPPLRDVIRRHGLAAKKSLGQNFILDLNLTAKIASRLGRLDGRLVIEVGPGPGGLTRALLEQNARRVIAIERDERCLAALDEVAARWPGRLSVHPADALEVDWPELVGPYLTRPNEKALIIANLPYGIATRLLVDWLETEPWPPWFDGMALMFQREVSRVLFGQRRKMIRATMKELLATPELLLDRLGIDPTRRAETMSLEEITSLAAEIHRLRNEPGDSNTSK